MRAAWRAAAPAPRRPRQAVAKDLLDAYQARLRELLADADAAPSGGFGARQAEAAAQAAGYFDDPRRRATREDRGAAAARAASAAFAALGARRPRAATPTATAPRARRSTAP